MMQNPLPMLSLLEAYSHEVGGNGHAFDCLHNEIKDVTRVAAVQKNTLPSFNPAWQRL